MGKKSKPFIDKKTAKRFELVHRAQSDLLLHEEGVSPYILLPVENKSNRKIQGVELTDSEYSDYEEGSELEDEEYDYSQHFKSIGDGVFIHPSGEVTNSSEITDLVPEEMLPPEMRKAAVFESNLIDDENEIDPEIAYLLEHSDEEGEELIDDFMEKATAGNKVEFNFAEHLEKLLKGEKRVQFNSTELETEIDQPKRSHVEVREINPERNDERDVDKEFEAILDQYNDEDIGELDGEEIEGELELDDQKLQDAIKEFLEGKQQTDLVIKDEEEKRRILKYVEKCELEDSKKEVYIDDVCAYTSDEDDKWDVETIRTTFTNTENHPNVIKENKIKLSKRTGLPINTTEKIKKEYGKVAEIKHKREFPIKNVNETPEEKKERKRLIKEIKQERREIKKNLKTEFKQEKMKINVPKVNK